MAEVAQTTRSGKRVQQDGQLNYQAIFEAVFENALDGMEVIDAQTGRIVLANEAAARIFGFSSPEEMAGIDPLDYVPAEDRERIAAMVAEYMFEKDLHKVMELRAVTKHGRGIWLRSLGVTTEHQGKLAGLVSFKDITQQKQGEAKLQASEEEKRLLLDNASLAIVVVQDGMLKFANPKAAEMSGYSPEELPSRAFTDLIYLDDCQTVTKAYHDLLAGNEIPRGLTFRVATKDGRTLWAGLTAVSFTWEEKPAVWCFINDITERKQAQEALRDSEKRYRLLAENISDAIWVTDMNLRFTYLSPSWVRLTGYSVEEGMASRMHESLTPASVEVVTEAFAKAAGSQGKAGKDGVPSLPSLQLEMIRKDGSTIWLEATGSLIRDSEGRPVEMVGILRDITERRRAEETLRASQEKFRLLTEKTGDIIWTLDLSLRTTYVSPSIEKVLGFTPEERLSQDPQMQMTPESFAQVQVLLCAEFEQERQQGHGLDPERTVKVEVEYYHKNGSTVWLENLISGIRDAKGTLIGIHGVSRDITERKRAEELFVALSVSSPVGIYIVSDGSFQFTNPQFQRYVGYDEDELFGKDPMELVAPEDRDIVRENAVRMLKGDHSSSYEYRIVNKAGERRWVVETVTSIQYRGRRAALGNFVDITERKQGEEQLQQSLQKLQKTMDNTIEAITLTVETKDPYTAGHQRRVTQLACAIAREMDLTSEQIQVVHIAGLLHDLGKIYIPTEILVKPGQLNEIELSLIKVHPQAGYDILKTIEFGWPIADIVLQHHERINGSGYPLGLQDEDIMLEAKILAVADVVEAMTSYRPYRPALGIEKALEEVSRNSGILYDPDAVYACLSVFTQNGFLFEERGTIGHSPCVSQS